MTTVRLQHPALLTGTRSASWTPVLAISPLGSHAPFRVEFRWTCRRSSQRQLPLSRYRTHRTLLRRRRHPGSLDIRAPWFVGGPCCSAAGPPPSCPCPPVRQRATGTPMAGMCVGMWRGRLVLSRRFWPLIPATTALQPPGRHTTVLGSSRYWGRTSSYWRQPGSMRKQLFKIKDRTSFKQKQNNVIFVPQAVVFNLQCIPRYKKYIPKLKLSFNFLTLFCCF